MDRATAKDIETAIRGSALPGTAAAAGLIQLLAILESKGALDEGEVASVMGAMEADTRVIGLPLDAGARVREQFRAFLAQARAASPR